MQNKKTIFFIALCGFLCVTTVKGRLFMLRPVWIQSVQTSFPGSICRNVSEQAVNCAFETNSSCQTIVSNAVEKCLDNGKESLPFIVFNLTRGRQLEDDIRACLTHSLSLLPKGKNRSDRHCVELLHTTPLESEADKRNWQFLQDLLNSESIKALEEEMPGMSLAVYQRGVRDETFGKEIVMAQVEARKRLILFAVDEDVLDFARARFKTMLLLCKHAEMPQSVKNVAGAGPEKAARELEQMKSRDLNQGGKFEDLGKAISSIPQEALLRSEEETDKAIARIIRNARVKRTSEPSAETITSGFQKLQALLTQEELGVLDSNPGGCKSTEIFSHKAFQLDPVYSVPVMKQVFR